MVFLHSHFPVKGAQKLELGYGFALPRVVARSIGNEARRAQFSGVESYGVCLLFFVMHYLFLARLLIVPSVGASWLRIVFLLLLPIATWIYFLLLYYAISLVLRLFRNFGLFVSMPNNRFQSVILTALTAVIALRFLRASEFRLVWLGWLFLGLLLFNLLAAATEKSVNAK